MISMSRGRVVCFDGSRRWRGRPWCVIFLVLFFDAVGKGAGQTSCSILLGKEIVEGKILISRSRVRQRRQSMSAKEGIGEDC